MGELAFPCIRAAGVDGMLVSFGDRLTDPANRAALALRAAIEAKGWDGVLETSPTLASTYVRFDPQQISHAELQDRLSRLLDSTDWTAQPLPAGRRLWRIPTVFGGDHGPDLPHVAQAAGVDPARAVEMLSETPVRVQALGFSPGQPYLGPLAPAFDIPRRTDLAPQVPNGALTLAIRQFVLFGVDAPTGWHHVGQTAARLCQPEADAPYLLRPGDEVLFAPVTARILAELRDRSDGGVTGETLP